MQGVVGTQNLGSKDGFGSLSFYLWIDVGGVMKIYLCDDEQKMREELVLTYNSNYITASEILEVILKQTSLREVSIQKPDLADVIFAIKGDKREEEERTS